MTTQRFFIHGLSSGTAKCGTELPPIFAEFIDIIANLMSAIRQTFADSCDGKTEVSGKELYEWESRRSNW